MVSLSPSHIQFIKKQSSSAPQSVVRGVRATINGGRLEQRRPYGEERRREYVHHRRQNARQVHRNALRRPRARIGLPYVGRRFILLLFSPLTRCCAPASDLILQRARTVEDTVCKDGKGTTATYKSKIRMLFVNLKDKNNPGLRRSVTAGDIPAQTFARMTSQVCLPADDYV